MQDDSEEEYGFYHHSNVVDHKNEGERQKCHGYIYRFLSPTKLNRNEIAVYS